MKKINLILNLTDEEFEAVQDAGLKENKWVKKYLEGVLRERIEELIGSSSI